MKRLARVRPVAEAAFWSAFAQPLGPCLSTAARLAIQTSPPGPIVLSLLDTPAE